MFASGRPSAPLVIAPCASPTADVASLTSPLTSRQRRHTTDATSCIPYPEKDMRRGYSASSCCSAAGSPRHYAPPTIFNPNLGNESPLSVPSDSYLTTPRAVPGGALLSETLFSLCSGAGVSDDDDDDDDEVHGERLLLCDDEDVFDSALSSISVLPDGIVPPPPPPLSTQTIVVNDAPRSFSNYYHIDDDGDVSATQHCTLKRCYCFETPLSTGNVKCETNYGRIDPTQHNQDCALLAAAIHHQVFQPCHHMLVNNHLSRVTHKLPTSLANCVNSKTTVSTVAPPPPGRRMRFNEKAWTTAVKPFGAGL